MTGAFAEAVAIFAAQGVPVIPTQWDVPAKPMVMNPARCGVRGSRTLAENPKFATANAAIWTGRRNRSSPALTVVDIDSPKPSHTQEAIKAFGDTPLKIATPSGGVHLYYGSGGEGRRIRPFGKSLPLDVLGNGLAVVPPSQRIATGKKRAGQYRVIEGDLAALDRLPIIRGGVLPPRHETAATPHANDSGTALTEMREGDGRDNGLFRFARIAAKSADTLDDLRLAVRAENAKMAEPLPDAIADTKAEGAWRYKLEGRLMVPGTRATLTDKGAIAECRGRPLAYMLLALLRCQHSPGHVFAIVPRAMEEVLGKSHNTIRRAKDWLLKTGKLIQVGRGSYSALGATPHLYRLAPW